MGGVRGVVCFMERSPRCVLKMGTIDHSNPLFVCFFIYIGNKKYIKTKRLQRGQHNPLQRLGQTIVKKMCTKE